MNNIIRGETADRHGRARERAEKIGGVVRGSRKKIKKFGFYNIIIKTLYIILYDAYEIAENC